jgi:hypothetical protein
MEPGIDSEESIHRAYVAWQAAVRQIGLSYWPAALGIDSWAPEKVYKYGLWSTSLTFQEQCNWPQLVEPLISLLVVSAIFQTITPHISLFSTPHRLHRHTDRHTDTHSDTQTQTDTHSDTQTHSNTQTQTAFTAKRCGSTYLQYTFCIVQTRLPASFTTERFLVAAFAARGHYAW